jgi:hypothetical protein
MTNWAAVDVAIGIVVVYVLLSRIASTIDESIATALGPRTPHPTRRHRALAAYPVGT